MKKILITGGAGFIGSNLTLRLLAQNQFQITCIDNFDAFYNPEIKIENVRPFLDHKNYCLIEGDIRKNKDLNKVQNVDIILHLAAKAGVRQSIQNPLIYQDVNVTGTQNLLEFAHRRQIKQFIFASSSSVYGLSPNTPWLEEEKLLPISPYASSKLSVEMLGHVYSHLYQIQFLALRFFTVYGPRQRPDLAIHKFFDLAYKGVPIPVFGDGNTYRDYTYIDDIIDGIEAAINYKKSNFEIINLGCGNPVTLNRLIQVIEHTCEIKVAVDRIAMQPGDVNATFADITKARKLLNYNPKIDIQTGIRLFHDWFIKCR